MLQHRCISCDGACCCLLQQISMWRSSDPNDKRTEDVILHDDFDTCPPISVQRRRRHGDHRRKRAGEKVVASTNQLWPYSRISATVATLNTASVGYQSEPIEIHTPEGRKLFCDVSGSVLAPLLVIMYTTPLSTLISSLFFELSPLCRRYSTYFFFYP